MLVGILSMQKIVNYGSFMQAYSLKKMVESLGHRVVFVDYKPNVLIEDRNDKTKRVRRISVHSFCFIFKDSVFASVFHWL